MSKIKKNKKIGLLVLLIIYILATLIGVLTYSLFPDLNVLLRILIGDIAATIFVWLTGIFLSTASTYDPYWSVQTFIIGVLLTSFSGNWNIGNVIFTSAIFIYSFRLTYNFITTFYSLEYEDWRYKNLKDKTGKFYYLVDFLGICLLPTLVVFFASVPYFLYILNDTAFQINQLLGISIILISVAIEYFSDKQIHAFIKQRKDRSKICRLGLWKNTRHPNYLGEIFVWVGILITYIFYDYSNWIIYVGIISIYLLFRFISIPMAEKHYEKYKADYSQYKKETFSLMLLPFSKKDFRQNILLKLKKSN